MKKQIMGVVFSRWTCLQPLRKQLDKVRTEFFNSENLAVIQAIIPLRTSYEESYPKGFPLDEMMPRMLESEMIEDTAKIVGEAIKEKVQINLIISNCARHNVP